MKPTLTIIIAVICSVLITGLFAKNQTGNNSKQTAFDRIMSTNTIRCGYYVFPPITMRDPNTNELSGMAVDLMNEIGKRANLKIEWTEEVTFGNWVPALQNDRYDVTCTPMWSDIAAAREVSFSKPLFFSGLYPVVLETDRRFDTLDPARFNQPDVLFLTMDGNATDTLIRAVFPNAKRHAMPASTDGGALYQELATGKAQAAVSDINAVTQYNKRNDVKLKIIPLNIPVKLQAFSFAVNQNNTQLLYFLDNAVSDLQYDGYMDRLLTTWEETPNAFLRTNLPFREMEK